MRRIAMQLGALLFALAASGCECSSSAECSPGAEGCACAEGARCLTGLSCRGDRCIDPANPDRFDGGGARDGGMRPPDARPNPEAFWAMDPPPRQCLADGTMSPLPNPPGGTPECPDDKNREGCVCNNIGEMAPCWPGLRVNRNQGMCMDGMTRCEPYDEFYGVWGPCVGYVLPVPGVTRGPSACRCFSEGRWQIDTLSPCFITDGPGDDSRVLYTVSPNGTAGCAHPGSGWPATAPATSPFASWSPNRLTVDCEGRFNLCYTIKAGDGNNPQATDCVLARSCTGPTWYSTRDAVQEFPALPSWVSSDTACGQRAKDVGAYGEMTVVGLSVACDPVDDGSGAEFVFNRVNYCPLRCNRTPDAEECRNCMTGGSGMF